MVRAITSIWLWLAAYLTIISCIAVYTIHLRSQMLADAPEIAKEKQSWDEWRATAAKQDGTHGPVQRVVPKSPEPPMLLMMRDSFAAILGAMIVFPGIILGFFMLVLRGVLVQYLARKAATDHGPLTTDTA